MTFLCKSTKWSRKTLFIQISLKKSKNKKTQEHKNGILNLPWAINKKCREDNFTYIGSNSNPDPNAKQTLIRILTKISKNHVGTWL